MKLADLLKTTTAKSIEEQQISLDKRVEEAYLRFKAAALAAARTGDRYCTVLIGDRKDPDGVKNVLETSFRNRLRKEGLEAGYAIDTVYGQRSIYVSW